MTCRGTRTAVEPPSSPTMSTTSLSPSAPSSAKLFAWVVGTRSAVPGSGVLQGCRSRTAALTDISLLTLACLYFSSV